MKKIVKRVRSSSHVQFVILGIIVLLATLAIVAGSATSAQNPGSPVVQQKFKSSAVGSGNEQFMVRMMPSTLPGPVSFGIDLPARVRAFLPSVNVLINNNSGFSCTQGFTHSETTVLSFGSTIIGGFNDSGSFSFGNHFTGWSRSTDGGATWTDGGTLPASSAGDAGDPVLARDSTSGRIYFATLGFTDENVIQVFRSTDNGATWLAPVNGTPGGASEDKEWITVDNFAGSGNGNVYLVARNFGAGNGIYFTRSTDGGATWGPSGGTLIASGSTGNVQGAFVTVSPDHSVHAYWYDSAAPSGIKVRKSTDQGVTFGSAVTVVTFVTPGGTNGDLGLTGTVNGGGTSGFRSNRFPHQAVNPVSGNIYCAYNDKVTSGDPDKSNVYFVQSTDGGATWSARTQVNDDGTTTDQWQPNVVVSPAGDRIGIFYYSRQEDTATNNLFKYYGRLGTISGGTVTFAPSSAVSDTASFPEFGRDAVVNSVYMGDYDIAYARPGFFDVTWSDNRNDFGCAPKKEPDVFYQSIALGTPCMGDYTFTVGSGPIVPGTADTGNHTDDGTTFISLPFTYQLYGQSFTGAHLSSNGNLQFVSNSNLLTNACPLPTASFNFPIMPHWDDLRTDQVGTGCTAYGGVGCGVFTSTSGTAPNRIFNIEWRTVYFGANTTRANFEVRLYEGQNRFDLVYGEVAQGGSSATVGVQQATGSQFTQFECNTAGTLTSGLQLVFTEPPCITLTASGRRVQGRHTVDLSWGGSNAANIDIYRNGVVIATVPNNGAYKDLIGVRGGNVRYTYKVCDAGTTNCSNEVTVRFGGPPI
jgi:hypothetical protein